MTHARLDGVAWGDAEHSFDLGPIKLLLELEEKCNAGLGAILARLSMSEWYINDVRETLRLGLIGAGMEPIKAFATVNRYGPPGRPVAESVPVAKAVLLAVILGVPGDNEVGKAEADRTSSEATGALSDPPSMAAAPP